MPIQPKTMSCQEVASLFPSGCRVEFNCLHCSGRGKVVGVFPGDACNFKMAIEYDADTQWSREGYYQLYPVFLVDLYGSENAFLGDRSVISVKRI